jgi:hypothetical protein
MTHAEHIEITNRGGMSKRNKRIRRRRRVAGAERTERAPLEKPFGQGVVAELEEFAEHSAGSSRRYRNHGESPLALAYHRHRLDGVGHNAELVARRRFKAGEDFRAYFEATMSPGRSSMEPSIGGGSRTNLADAQIDAGRFLARIREAMGETQNYTIIEAFCGMGHSMVDALRLADVPFSPQGVLPRILEALDVLVRILNKPLPQAKSRLDVGA